MPSALNHLRRPGRPRYTDRADSFIRPDVPEDCLAYLRTMSEMNGPEHTRLRKLVSPAFTARARPGHLAAGVTVRDPLPAEPVMRLKARVGTGRG